MSCIANFYLDGIKYSLEDFDMNDSTTQSLLKKVIATAKLSVEEKAMQNDIFNSDRIDLFSDEGLGTINLEMKDQEVLTEADDEALLNSL